MIDDTGPGTGPIERPEAVDGAGHAGQHADRWRPVSRSAALAVIVVGTLGMSLTIGIARATAHTLLSGRGVSVFATDELPAYVIAPGEQYRFQITFQLIAHEPLFISHRMWFIYEPDGSRQTVPSATQGTVRSHADHGSRHAAAGHNAAHPGTLVTHGASRQIVAGLHTEALTFRVPTSWTPGLYTYHVRLAASRRRDGGGPVASLEDARGFLVAVGS